MLNIDIVSKIRKHGPIITGFYTMKYVMKPCSSCILRYDFKITDMSKKNVPSIEKRL